MSAVRVAVVGAGVVGANIAYRLAARGAEVTILDAGTPGRGTSGASISWLSSFPQIANSTPSGVADRSAAHGRFHELEDEIGGEWMHWTGTLTWGAGAAAQRLERDFLAMQDLGAPVRKVEPGELAELDPALSAPPGATVYLEDGGGWVDAPALVGTLLDGAVAHGARLRPAMPVTGLVREPGHWRVITPAEEFDADVVVNAAGIWASQIGALAQAPVPLDLRPGLIVYSTRLALPLRNVLNAPEINLRPDPSGGVAIHWRGEDTYTGHGYNAAEPDGVLALAAELLPELVGSSPERTAVGVRPVPPGGPIIGWHPSAPGLFVAVSHGGVGWGPRWAQIAAAAILDEADDPRWGVFSPERFFREPRPTAGLAAAHALDHVPAQM